MSSYVYFHTQLLFPTQWWKKFLNCISFCHCHGFGWLYLPSKEKNISNDKYKQNKKHISSFSSTYFLVSITRLHIKKVCDKIKNYSQSTIFFLLAITSKLNRLHIGYIYFFIASDEKNISCDYTHYSCGSSYLSWERPSINFG